MEAKPYPAFGYVLLRTKIKAGELISDDALINNVLYIDNAATDHTGSVNGSKGAYVWLLISGLHEYKNTETGEVKLHEPGWCNLVHKPAAGTYEFDVLEDSEQICFSPTVNSDRVPTIPQLEFFELSDGDSCELAQGTKLYLVSGNLSVAGKTIQSMRQVRIASGDQTVSAVGRCLGFIFKI